MLIKRLITLILVSVLLTSGLSFSGSSTEDKTGDLPDPIKLAPLPLYAGGDGSVNNPYQIANLTDLQNMNQRLDKHYVLVNDIDASNSSKWNWDGNKHLGF